MNRMKRPLACTIAATCALLLAAGWAPPRIARAQAGEATAAVSALIKTAPLQRQDLPRILEALGEVSTGSVESVNFPNAGQIEKLLVTPGQPVKRGAPLVVLGADPAARLVYAQAGSAVQFAQAELKRNEDLFALQLATTAQVDAARRSLRDAEAGLAAQRGLGGDSARATIRAPFDGVITTLAVAQGDRVQPGASILQLGRADTLRVKLGIEPDERALLRTGMPVTVHGLQDADPQAHGTVTLVQDIVDPKSRLVSVVVTVPRAAAAEWLIPGMHVRARIELGKVHAWVVPRNAVLNDTDGTYLYQVADGKARRVSVRQTLQAGKRVAVEGSALDARQPVVVLGNYVLQDGMPVREEEK